LTGPTRRHRDERWQSDPSGGRGALFVGHGTQKLFGWFGGGGPEATAQTMERLELRPPRAHAIAAGEAEAASGAMLAAGGLTPVASTFLSSVMITAIRKVHGKNGAWNTGGGYEYNAVLLAALFALSVEGPGRYSVDARAFPRLRGPKLAFAQLALAYAGSRLATSELVDSAAREAEHVMADISADSTPEPERVAVAA
jgi:putative oxidoreductase